MSAGNILNLNQPMGARLIRILYCIALVLITLMVLGGIVRGVRTMMGPPPMTQQTAAAAPMPGPPPPAATPNRPDFGPGNFRRGFGRPGMRGPGMRGPMRMRGPFIMGMRLPPPAAGALQIFLALLHGLITLLIIRVLAEIGTAILAMGPKQAS